MRFKCSTCDQWHTGIPGWGWRYPFAYHKIPEEQRTKRCYLTDDLCAIDNRQFLICGLLELRVVASSDVLSLQVWAEVDRASWFHYQDLIGVAARGQFGPYAGRLDSTIPTYPDTYGFSVSLVVRDAGIRPLVQLATIDHPLFAEQQAGVEVARIAQLYDFFEHGKSDA